MPSGHDAGPRRSPRGGACVAHTFAAYVRARPELAWTALTDADQTAAYLYGLAAHSTWIPGAPIGFCLGDRTELTGRVLHAQRPERLSYVLQSAPHDPPTYLTWLIRPAAGGCTIRLEIATKSSWDGSIQGPTLSFPPMAPNCCAASARACR